MDIVVRNERYVLVGGGVRGSAVAYCGRAGGGATRGGKMPAGAVDECGRSFLDGEQSEAGFVLTWVAYRTSDCTIKSHAEEERY